MDIGFGAFLDKFEERFGKRVTTLLLAVIGLATAVICCSVIWNIALGPAVAWILGAVDGLSIWSGLVLVAWYGAGVVVGLSAASMAAESLLRWQRLRSIRTVQAESRKILAESQDLTAKQEKDFDGIMAEARELSGQTSDTLLAAQRILAMLEEAGQKSQGD